MNNKGFTLVELLAVIVILLAVSVITVTNVTASLKSNDDKEYATYQNLAINAAKIYFSMEDNYGYIKIDDLIKKNYLKDDGKYYSLPKTGTKLIDKYVVICNNKNQYVVKDNKNLAC